MPPEKAPQSDPWAEAAKNFKAQPQGESAPTSAQGNEDWKIWQQDQGGGQPQQGNTIQRVFDQATEATPYSLDKGVFGNALTAGGNLLKGMAGLAAPFVHPIETAKGAVGMARALSNPYDTSNPAIQGIVKPFVPQPGEDLGSYAGRVGGEATKTAGSALALKGIGMAGEGVANLRDPLRAYRSPLIPENEAIARAATDIIRPNPLEYRKMVTNLTTRLPEAKEYLQRSGINKPSSPLEFGKGATGAGKEASGFFQEKMIAPNADAPAGSGTVGSVYSEVGKINDKLRPIYRSQTMGEQLTKEASDRMEELESQRDRLNGVLYKSLSDRTGMPVEQIQDINQRGAQLQGVGDVTDAAQAVRQMGLTYSPGGMRIPMGNLERVTRALEFFRGGPEAVAGRKLGRVLNQVKESPQALPDADALENYRQNFASQEQDAAAQNRQASMARKPEGMGPTQYPGRVVHYPTQEAEVLSNRAGRSASRSEGIANRAAQQRAEDLVRAQREQELLQRAREQQGASRMLRNKE